MNNFIHGPGLIIFVIYDDCIALRLREDLAYLRKHSKINVN